MIRAIFIPSEISQAPEIREIIPDLETLTDLVGGDVDALELQDPAGTLYLEYAAQVNQGRFNQRATALVQRHCPSHAGFIVGDTVLVGPADENDEDTDVAAAYVAYLQPVG